MVGRARHLERFQPLLEGEGWSKKRVAVAIDADLDLAPILSPDAAAQHARARYVTYVTARHELRLIRASSNTGTEPTPSPETVRRQSAPRPAAAYPRAPSTWH